MTAVVGILSLGVRPARADRAPFQIYDADQGLSSADGSCLMQGPGGLILVCTEHGIATYDGRRFLGLGSQQGLSDGGVAYDLVATASGRLAVRFADKLFLSDGPSGSAGLPSSLTFRAVAHPGLEFYDEYPHRLATWHGGLALLADGRTVRIAVPGAGPPSLARMAYTPTEAAMLKDAQAIFSIRGSLWESTENGSLCMADPGAVRCFSKSDGLDGTRLVDAAPGPGGSVMARSLKTVATLAPGADRWTIAPLPGQGDRYINFAADLGLFRSPGGQITTQTDGGMATFRDGRWEDAASPLGAPAGMIAGAMTDAGGQFWYRILGVGLARSIGYGEWEWLQKGQGLSDGFPWMATRVPGGALWVSTDTGIDEVVRRGSVLAVDRVLPGNAFVMAVSPRNRLWTSIGASGLRIVDPSGGVETRLDMPAVDAIFADQSGKVWIGTQKGLFGTRDGPGQIPVPTKQGNLTSPVLAVVGDGSGGVYYLSGGRVRHMTAAGADTTVWSSWPSGGFEPLAMARGGDGDVWVGGAGGLFRIRVGPGKAVSCDMIPQGDIRTNSVVAVLVDDRGWVWVGTPLGISAFDGHRWVSVDADGGLLSNDVSQGGITEDTDGSIWVATSIGVSHLLDPALLFARPPVKVVISGAAIAGRQLNGRPLPWTDQALSLQFGSTSYGDARSVVFRYRLSGVDAGWAESETGDVRYPFVPPGHHVLEVIATDRMTHRSSDASSLTVDIAYPWWRRWWSEAACALLAATAAWGGVRLRVRSILRREAELRRLVFKATEQLRYQAAHDSLTGLLNRSEIEQRLAARLCGTRGGDEIIVALVDIDHFKRINDSYGHLGGDDVLRVLGRLVGSAMGEADQAGRYGGEEFLLVMADADGRGAERVLALHDAIRSEILLTRGGPIRVTCSIGIAWAVRGDDWESLVGRADKALYQAKEAGRDRVIEGLRPGAVGGIGANTADLSGEGTAE
ncbi:diguanylate cyclase [Lichenicola sp.]|uniref:ligand-binding sensor domain-containing diguanylate cyclase n=1 Tax=Lichenicola sp. TaxID=2804529 RepID=UPI003B00B798